jgi:hypothetical protein
MRVRRGFGPSFLIALSLVAFGIGCGGGGGGKAAGEEGGACYPNDSCNNGRDCSGTNPVITVVMDRARNCMATFTQIN